MDWQSLVSTSVAALCLAWLLWRFAKSFSRSGSGTCAGCESASCSQQPSPAASDGLAIEPAPVVRS